MNEIADSLHGMPPGVDLEPVDRFPAHEGRKQACQAQDVVEVTVRDQNPIQSSKTDSGLQDLALRALTAVNQESLLTVADDLRREPAPD
jgi:hypothetical protein